MWSYEDICSSWCLMSHVFAWSVNFVGQELFWHQLVWRNLPSTCVGQLLSSLLVLSWANTCKPQWFSFCRHQVLRIVPKDEVQLALIKDLEDMSEVEPQYKPEDSVDHRWRYIWHLILFLILEINKHMWEKTPNTHSILFLFVFVFSSLSWISGRMWLMWPILLTSEFPLTVWWSSRPTWWVRTSTTPSWLTTCRYRGVTGPGSTTSGGGFISNSVCVSVVQVMLDEEQQEMESAARLGQPRSTDTFDFSRYHNLNEVSVLKILQ